MPLSNAAPVRGRSQARGNAERTGRMVDMNTKMNKDWNPDSVEQKYERNFIDNDADIISNARQVEGIVSHETQLGMLPGSIVDDAQEELLRIRQEAADEEQIPMAVV